MIHELPSPDQPQNRESASKAPMDEVDAISIDKAKAEQRARLVDRETLDNHQANLTSLVMDHWGQVKNGATCFGVPVDESMVPDKIVRCLIQIEADYEFDVEESLLGGDFCIEEIGEFLRDELVHSDKEDHLIHAQDLVADKKETLSSYSAQVEKWKPDADWQAKSNHAKVTDILAHPDVPES